jgi:hypothetical protein
MSEDHTKEQQHGEDIDVLELLEEELKSCVMPAIKDPSMATTDDLVKDMHCVLSGNGGIARGLIYKVAASNVNTKLLRKTTHELRDKVEKQEEKCIAHLKTAEKEEIVAAADRLDTRKVGTVLWGNRYLVIAILAGVVMVVINTLHPTTGEVASQPDNSKSIKRLETMIETIMKVEGIDPSMKKLDAKKGTTSNISNVSSTAVAVVVPTRGASKN